MRITGALIGDRALVRRIERLPLAIKARMDVTVMALGLELERRVKTSYLRGPRPVRLGVVRGRLVNSISRGAAESRSKMESTPTKSIYTVGTNVEYGKYWEHGFTHRGGKHLQRPFLAPALQDMRALIESRITAALKAGAAAGMRE